MRKFLFHTTPNPAYLVFLRVATGLILGISLLSLWPDFDKLYTPSGLVDHELLTLQQTYPVFSLYDLILLLERHAPVNTENIVNGLAAGYLVVCTLLIAGLLTRVSAFLLLLAHGTIFTALPQFSYGFDYFCTIALFYCLVFPTGHYGSLDRRFFHLQPSSWSAPGLRILQLHLCLVYFFSGLDKALGHTWRNGEALWKTLQLPYFGDAVLLDFSWAAVHPWLFVAGGWLVFLTELLYPVFIWPPVTRGPYLGLTVGMHLAIAFFLGLYLFSAIMIALNIAAFYFDLPAQGSNGFFRYAKRITSQFRIRKMSPG